MFSRFNSFYHIISLLLSHLNIFYKSHSSIRTKRCVCCVQFTETEEKICVIKSHRVKAKYKKVFNYILCMHACQHIMCRLDIICIKSSFISVICLCIERFMVVIVVERASVAQMIDNRTSTIVAARYKIDEFALVPFLRISIWRLLCRLLAYAYIIICMNVWMIIIIISVCWLQ